MMALAYNFNILRSLWTLLKLPEGRGGQKTGPKLVLCSSRLPEKVFRAVPSNLSAQCSALACLPLGQMCIHISRLTFPMRCEEGNFFFPHVVRKCL